MSDQTTSVNSGFTGRTTNSRTDSRYNSVQMKRKKSGSPAPKRRRMKHLLVDSFLVRDKGETYSVLHGRQSGSHASAGSPLLEVAIN